MLELYPVSYNLFLMSTVEMFIKYFCMFKFVKFVLINLLNN